MKKFIIILLCGISLTSCVEVLYEKTQPQKTNTLNTFPKELQGKYYISYKDSLNESDTLVISTNYFTELTLTKKENIQQEKMKVYLSDSLVLKELGNNYVLNFKEKETWMALVLKPIENYGYSVTWIDGDNEDSVEKMQKIIEAKIIRNKDDKIEKYIINPKKSDFKKLLKSKGIFTEIYKLKKL